VISTSLLAHPEKETTLCSASHSASFAWVADRRKSSKTRSCATTALRRANVADGTLSFSWKGSTRDAGAVASAVETIPGVKVTSWEAEE
jgi:fructose-1,6-bisphosphatase/inositol monophosphatase family enzyme